MKKRVFIEGIEELNKIRIYKVILRIILEIYTRYNFKTFKGFFISVIVIRRLQRTHYSYFSTFRPS